MPHPFIIGAITGGAPDVAGLNARLAEVARETGAPMAVGSQYAALERPDLEETYRIVRRINPHGIVLANLGAHASVRQARTAVDMVGAQALQIHLNPAQETVMAEGDRDFRGRLETIRQIAAAMSVPVMVKETGCGIARDEALLLFDAGVQILDVAGAGGTNFVRIEAARSGRSLSPELESWGIPTAASALELAAVLPPGKAMVVSGGVRSGLDAAKALASGASAVSLAGPVLRAIVEGGAQAGIALIQRLIDELRAVMLILGVRRPSALTGCPMVVLGKTREWLKARGAEPDRTAVRPRFRDGC